MRTALVIGLLCAGCVEPRDCAMDAGVPELDAPSDARAPRPVLLDAPSRWGGGVAFDAAFACETLLDVSIVVMESPTAGYRACTPPHTDEPVRVWMFVPGNPTPVVDATYVCGEPGTLPRVSEGRYLIAIQVGPYMVGGRLVHPELCTDAAFDDPYCEPIGVTLRRCDLRPLRPLLFCNPLAGDCPDVTWPWDE